MCCRLRKTLSRGRSVLPLSFRRMRRWRRWRAVLVSSGLYICASGAGVRCQVSGVSRARNHRHPKPETRGRERSEHLLLLRAGLAGLTADDFFGVLDAFALVRLGWPHAADLRRDLTHQLLVRATDGDRVGLNGEGDARRCWVQHRVREADLQYQVATAHRGAVADAIDLESPTEAVGYPRNHVGDQGARETMQ